MNLIRYVLEEGQSPFKLLRFQAGGKWMYATGIKFTPMLIGHYGTTEFVASQLYFSVRGIPILFPSAILAMKGSHDITCITAAGRAFIRGWFPFFP